MSFPIFRLASPALALVCCLALLPTGRLAADVFSNVPEATAEGYQVLYELNLPTDASYRNATAPAYTVDNSAAAPACDRVAYYLELSLSGGGTQWVYASMDAFTTVPKQFGLPHHVLNPVKHQRVVENLNIVSNVAGVQTGHSIDGGVIEMWPSDYDANRSLFYAGNGGTFDWDDSNGSATTAGFGSFQVHNPIARQVVFAYNRWGVADGSSDDIGIGNSTTGNPDYTFAANAGNYTARKLVVLIRPGTHTVFSKMPSNRELYPRNLATNLATVPVQGNETAGGYDAAILRIQREGVFLSETTQPLVYSAGKAPFGFSPAIPAELAGYTFEVFMEKSGVRTLVRRAADVVAGDTLLFYGQSNTEAGKDWVGGNTTSNGYAGRWVRTFGQNADSGDATRNNLSWMQADGDGRGSNFVDPGGVGQWAIVIGGQIAASHNIPVALLNGARGGYSMAQLQKDDAQPDNLDDGPGVTRSYGRLRYRAMKAGVASTARAMFYYQGESDRNNASSHSAGYAALYQDWQTDYPALEHFYVVQVRPGCGTDVARNSVELREAQRGFGDVYPHTSVMASNGLQAHDGCHYSFMGGYELLGLYHFAQVSRDLYGGPTLPDIDAPNPATVAFDGDDHSRIRLTLRDAASTILFPPGALGDFALVGGSASITGYQVAGNVIYFNLSGPAPSGVRLEYRSHQGPGDFVTNASGMGLLSFSMALGAAPPVLSFTAPAMTRAAAVGETVAIAAATSQGANGPATRLVFLVNGVPQAESAGATFSGSWVVPVAGAHVLEIRAYDAAGNFAIAQRTILTASGTSPGVPTSLKVWLRAESGVETDGGGQISAWRDQKGGFDAVQGNAAAQPVFIEKGLGNGPAIRFSGSQFLTGSGGMSTANYTKIVRFAINGSALNNLVSAATAATNGAADHAIYFDNGTAPKLYHSGPFLTSSQQVALRQPTIIHAGYNAVSNAGSIFVNNLNGGTGTAAGDNSVTNYQLGAFAGGAFLDGDLSDVLIYDRILTSNERITVFNYLDDKYRTPLSLWLKARPALAGSLAADPAGDGIPALVEYALGLDPAVNNSGSARLPQVQPDGAGWKVVYQQAAASPDVIVSLCVSNDLVNWTTVTAVPAGEAGGLKSFRYTLPTGAGGANGSFARLKVALPR